MKNLTAKTATVNREVLFALATNALSNEDVSLVTNIRWPEEQAMIAIDYDKDKADSHLRPFTAFGLGYRLGLLVGAEVTRNPLDKSELASVIDDFADELADELRVLNSIAS